MSVGLTVDLDVFRGASGSCLGADKPKLSALEPLGVAATAMTLIAIPAVKGDYVLVCKLDASGTTDQDSPVVCMAGYVASLPAWLSFEHAAKSIFDEYGVEVLEGKKFYRNKGEFRGWKDDKKESFIRDIQHNAILGRLDAGVVFSAPKAAWVSAKREHNLAHQESAFGFCFRAIIDALFGDAIIGEVLRKGETLSLVLEFGDSNAGDAQRIFNEAKAFSAFNRQKLYSFGFASKESARGLQIADFLAVTSRRYINLYSDNAGYAPEPQIASILREKLYLIDHSAVSFFPDLRKRKSS